MNRRSSIDHSIGTSLQGYLLDAPYHYLVGQLGDPVVDPHDKTRAEWTIQRGEVVATIYDYKDQDKELTQMTRWHIGGRSSWALDLVYREISEGWVTDRNGKEPDFCPSH